MVQSALKMEEIIPPVLDRRKSITKTPPASTFNIGIGKDVVVKIFNACKSNLMGKTNLEFFEKHDKKGDGIYSIAAFMKVKKG
jgi:hypothetical protein